MEVKGRGKNCPKVEKISGKFKGKISGKKIGKMAENQ